MEDAGMYQCETANSFTYNKSEPFYLNVLSEWPLLPHIFFKNCIFKNCFIIILGWHESHVHVWRLEDSQMKSVLSFHFYLGFKDWTWIISFVQ